ncbi:MAG: DUF2617 family protein [Saprospiraceae bacterium]
MILFKDVSYKILQLTVMLGDTDFSNLNIFKSEKKYNSTLGFSVYTGIIGTSHFVQIKHNGQIFTELFACETLDNHSEKTLCFLPIDALNNTVYLNPTPFKYQFDCQKLPYDTNIDRITNWITTQQKNDPFLFLTFDFKTPQEQFPTSRTIVSIQQKNNGITIKTIHEYQEENAIIVSESDILLEA